MCSSYSFRKYFKVESTGLGAVCPRAHIEALRRRWEVESERGQLTREQLRDMRAYQELLRQIREEIARFAQYAGEEMGQGAREALAQGLRDALREVELALPGIADMRIRRLWRNLNNEAVELLLGMTERGSPLRERMESTLGEAVAEQVADRLLENVALGKHPRETARTIRKETGVGLVWTLRTVRTAQLWSYRKAKHEAWAENPQLYRGWTWHAKLGPRTCPACIAMHGTRHGPDEVLNDHHNGRCVPVIIAPTYAEILGLPPIEGDLSPGERVPSGAEWFAAQPQAFQRQVLGDARYRAYQDGRLTMDEDRQSGIVGTRKDDVYGPLRVPRSLKDVLGEKAEPYYAGSEVP